MATEEKIQSGASVILNRVDVSAPVGADIAAPIIEETARISIPIAQYPIPDVIQPDTQELSLEGGCSGGLPQCPSSEFGGINPAPADRQSTSEIPESSTATPSEARWQYHPVPSETMMPDPYPEYACRLVSGAHDLRLIAARVRGKKHKHEGTNCDDWFEIASCGAWNLIAVADGAGSKQFSRVGAKTACEVAVTSLCTALNELRLEPRCWTDTTTVFARDQDDEFIQADLRLMGDSLRQAVLKAFQSVQQAAAVRRGSEHHQHALGRDIEVYDLSTTLLLMAHTVVRDGTGRPYDLAMSIAIGDGVIGALSWDGRVYLMMDADHGQFSGETEFLSARVMEPEWLKRRLRLFIGPPRRAFLVMSDGVADDYFPNNPGLARLFGDLTLNGLVGLPPLPDAETESLPALTDGASVESPTVAGARLTAEGTQHLALYSIQRYAEQLRMPLDQVLTEPALLRAGCRPDPLPGRDAAERLLTWLDAYQVRGSFDDRTLVIADRERPL